MADPPDTDPVDKTPREKGMERRSSMPAVSPWLVVGGLVMLGALAYVVGALL
jgi:hypothetical protein